MRFIFSVVALLMSAGIACAQSLPLARLSLNSSPIMVSDVTSGMLHWTDSETDVVLDVSVAGSAPLDIYEVAGSAPAAIVAGAFGSSVVHGGRRVNGIAFAGCPQFDCDYLGAIPHGGSLTCLVSYAQYARCDIWNFRNQIDVTLKAGESGGSYSVNTVASCYGAWNIAHSNPGNSLSVFTGLPQRFTVINERGAFVGSTIASQGYFHGIGWNGSLIPSGAWGQLASDNKNPMGMLQSPSYVSDYMTGSATATALECLQSPPGLSGTGGAFLNERSFLLMVTYRG